MVRGIGRMGILAGAGFAASMALASVMEPPIQSGQRQRRASGADSRTPAGIILDGSGRDLPPGECRYRPTGNKRSRRRRNG